MNERQRGFFVGDTLQGIGEPWRRAVILDFFKGVVRFRLTAEVEPFFISSIHEMDENWFQQMRVNPWFTQEMENELKTAKSSII